jgi:hypothetical protein
LFRSLVQARMQTTRPGGGIHTAAHATAVAEQELAADVLILCCPEVAACRLAVEPR